MVEGPDLRVEAQEDEEYQPVVVHDKVLVPEPPPQPWTAPVFRAPLGRRSVPGRRSRGGQVAGGAPTDETAVAARVPVGRRPRASSVPRFLSGISFRGLAGRRGAPGPLYPSVPRPLPCPSSSSFLSPSRLRLRFLRVFLRNTTLLNQCRAVLPRTPLRTPAAPERPEGEPGRPRSPSRRSVAHPPGTPDSGLRFLSVRPPRSETGVGDVWALFSVGTREPALSLSSLALSRRGAGSGSAPQFSQTPAVSDPK